MLRDDIRVASQHGLPRLKSKHCNLCTINAGNGCVARAGESSPNAPSASTISTIEVYAQIHNLVAVIECHGFGSMIGMGWWASGARLTCIFNDATVLEYCSITRSLKRSYRLTSCSPNITACTVTGLGALVSTSDSRVLFFQRSSRTLLDLNLSARSGQAVCLAVSIAYRGACYVATAHVLYLFSRLKSAQYPIQQTLAVATSPSGHVVATVTAEHVLLVLAADLQSCVFSSSLECQGSLRYLFWNTSSVLRVVFESSVFALHKQHDVVQSERLGAFEYDSSLTDIIIINWRQKELEVLSHHSEDDVRSTNWRNKLQKKIKPIHTLHRRSTDWRKHIEGIRTVSQRNSADAEELIKVNIDVFLTTLITCGITFSTQKGTLLIDSVQNYRERLSSFLVLNDKPYSALKVSSESHKCLIVSSWAKRLFQSMHSKVPDTSTKEVCGRLMHVPGVDIIGLCKRFQMKECEFCTLLHDMEPRVQAKLDFLLQREMFDKIAALFANAVDSDDVHRFQKALRTSACAEQTTVRHPVLVSVLSHYAKHIRRFCDSVANDNTSLRREILEKLLSEMYVATNLIPAMLTSKKTVLGLLCNSLEILRLSSSISGAMTECKCRNARVNILRSTDLNLHMNMFENSFDLADFVVLSMYMDEFAKAQSYAGLSYCVAHCKTAKDIIHFREVVDAYAIPSSIVSRLLSRFELRLRREAQVILMC